MTKEEFYTRRFGKSDKITNGLLASGKEKHPVKRAVQLTDALMEELSK